MHSCAGCFREGKAVSLRLMFDDGQGAASNGEWSLLSQGRVGRRVARNSLHLIYTSLTSR